MDEDQQQDGQQEQKISSSAFTSFNITPAPRRPISSLALFQRQSAESDEQIRGVVRKNQSAINTINLTLVNVTGQLRELSLSLVKVSTGIKDSAAIENLRIAQEQKQAQMLADRNARRGTENTLERGIQAALFAPVQRIGAKVRFTLGRLISFFNILLGGFLVGRVIKTIEALVKGDEKALKGIGDVIVKQLTAAGAIFVAINGGLGLAIRSLTQLAFFMGRIAISNLLLKPITLIFSVAKAAGAALVALAAAGLGGISIPPIRGNPRLPNNRRRNRVGGTSGNLFNILGAFQLREFAINQGTDPNVATAQSIGGLIAAGGLNRLGDRLQKSPNRFAKVGGFLLSTFSGVLGLGGAFSPQLVSLLDSAEVSNAISGNVNNFDDIFKNIEQSNIPNIVVEPTQRPSQPVTAEGRGALLMVTPSINDKNPYVLNSHLLYNVIV
tara:strand:+ start:1715 stop:3037 length:1323 start_codon:yes stop_codon:yes gene_type:complete